MCPWAIEVLNCIKVVMSTNIQTKIFNSTRFAVKAKAQLKEMKARGNTHVKQQLLAAQERTQQEYCHGRTNACTISCLSKSASKGKSAHRFLATFVRTDRGGNDASETSTQSKTQPPGRKRWKKCTRPKLSDREEKRA